MRPQFEFRPANFRQDELRRPEYFQAADRLAPKPDWHQTPEWRWKQDWRQIRHHLGSQLEFHSRDYKSNRTRAAFHRQFRQRSGINEQTGNNSKERAEDRKKGTPSAEYLTSNSKRASRGSIVVWLGSAECLRIELANRCRFALQEPSEQLVGFHKIRL